MTTHSLSWLIPKAFLPLLGKAERGENPNQGRAGNSSSQHPNPAAGPGAHTQFPGSNHRPLRSWELKKDPTTPWATEKLFYSSAGGRVEDILRIRSDDVWKTACSGCGFQLT